MSIRDEITGRSVTSYQNQLSQVEITEQLRGLLERVNKVDDKLSDLKETVNSQSTTDNTTLIPGMINLADNTDFGFRDTDYISATYSSPDSPDNVLAMWYQFVQSAGTLPVESTPSTESGQSIISSGTNVVWNKSAGTLRMSGGYYVMTPLRKPFAYKGAEVSIRMQLAKAVGATFGNNLRLRVSIHDGTSGQNKIIEGQVVTLTATPVGTTGVATRSYILEVVTTTGSFFSNVSPSSVSTVATSSINNSNYVALSWPQFLEASSYRIWRSASDVSGGYRLIGEIFNGATSLKDKGGIPSVRYNGTGTAPSQVNSKALAYIDGIGEQLTNDLQNFVFTIKVPVTYDPSLTTAKQYLRLELLHEDNSDTSTSDVSAGGLVVDKVGLSYTGGRWTPSANDQLVQATIQATNPLPSPGGGGGGSPPDPGGGGGDTNGGCFVASTLVTVLKLDGGREKLPISQIKKGMRVVSVDEKGYACESTVVRVIRKRTSKLYEFCTTSGKSVVCSPTQPFIRRVGDVQGQKAFKITERDTFLTLEGNDIQAVAEFLEYIESWNCPTNVYSLELNDKTRTFVANDIVVHNVLMKSF
jgi:cell wall assembly regulator SMI1